MFPTLLRKAANNYKFLYTNNYNDGRKYLSTTVKNSIFLHHCRSFSSDSINNKFVHSSDYPPEPIPNRPLRSPSRKPLPPPPNNPKSYSFNRSRGNENHRRDQNDNDFLERFKLGFEMDNVNNHGGGTISTSSSSSSSRSSSGMEAPVVSASSSAVVDDADEIFSKMKETGLIPNAVAMLDGLCKDGLVQEAMKLFGLMREKGMIPEVVIYTAVVDGFCKAHKFDDAVRIFKKMQSNGVVPNAFSYGVLIRGLCKGKRFEDAYGFCIEMLEAGHSPNLATFTGLIDGYCSMENGVEEAQKVISALKQKGFFFEEKAVREYLDKKGPFSPSVWEAILGKKKTSSKRALF